MNIGLFASKIQAEVLAERAVLEKAYREYPDSSLYWCMVDLAQSSNFRLSRGPEKGYIRGESFFSLVKAATRPYSDLRVFKEIGDAVLMCCSTIRPLFESGILMAQAARQLAYVVGDANYPFALRLGIEFGVAKQMTRRHEDYLGESIDRLARIMTMRSERTNFLMGEVAYANNRKIIDEYGAFCRASDPVQLQAPAGKQLNENVIYRELIIDFEKVADFADFFSEWRRSSGSTS